jgi:GTPase
VLVLSKADLVTEDEQARTAAAWATRLGGEVPVLVTSAATGQGLAELSLELLRRVPERPPVPEAVAGEGRGGPALDALAEHRTFRPGRERGFRVEPDGERRFRVLGPAADRLVARYDLGNEEALAHLERRLKGLGVMRELEAAGFEPGDDVEIGGVEFELDPGGAA